MTGEWRNYVKNSKASVVALPLVALATTSDYVNRREESIEWLESKTSDASVRGVVAE